MSVFALLVGINAYSGPVPPLRGAVADVHSALETLRVCVPPGDLHPLLLTDDAATRAAIIDGFRTHLASAGPGDAAVFWFSGHGSQTPAPLRFAPSEPTGQMQTLVCVDSRHDRTPDLLDKEVGILISEVAARGAHVVAVLDCCHSDGATREPSESRLRAASDVPALGVRWTEPPADLLSADLLLPELADLSGAGRRSADHVSLAACHSLEAAHEIPADGGHRGVFSLMLLKHLAQPGLTYRELVARVRCLVESEVPGQHPVLHPTLGELPDEPFLGGRAIRSSTAVTLRHARGVWQVDAGACHGMVVGTADDPMLLGLHDDPLRRQVRVVEVLPDRSVVQPVGWQPASTSEHYPVVVTRVPLPLATVAIGGEPADARTERRAAARQAARLVADAVHESGPGGKPSPHLKLVDSGDPGVLADLRVTFPESGLALIRGSDGTARDAPQPCADGAQARVFVSRIEHIARWRRIWTLENPHSPLNGAIAIDVVEALPHEDQDSLRRAPLVPDGGGAVALSYRREAGEWVAPDAFVRLRNTTDRHLYCVLLDLTDRYRMDPSLFPGGWVAPGTASASGGGQITFSLPPGREPVPGASGTDWFKVLIAEAPIDSSFFVLPRLGEPATHRYSPGQAFGGVVDRLGFAALYRDLPASAPPALDWATSIATVITSVPAD